MLFAETKIQPSFCASDYPQAQLPRRQRTFSYGCHVISKGGLRSPGYAQSGLLLAVSRILWTLSSTFDVQKRGIRHPDSWIKPSYLTCTYDDSNSTMLELLVD